MFTKQLFFIFSLIYLSCRGVAASSDQLEKIFGSKGCIKASIITIPSPGDTMASLVLDADSSKTMEGSQINLTQIINDSDLNFDKVQEKVLIHELAQFNKVSLKYSVIEENGPPHERIYKVRLTLKDDSYQENHEGQGSSISRAQQDAAANALKDTFLKAPPVKTPVVQTPTVVLNNVGLKLGIPITYSKHTPSSKSDGFAVDNKFKWMPINSSAKADLKLETQSLAMEESQVGGSFWMKVRVEDREFIGQGLTLQGAKHDAALKALEQLRKDVLVSKNVCLQEDSLDLCQERRDSLKNPISRVHELSLQLNTPLVFDVVEENGPPHKRVFLMRCKFGESVTEGQGLSKKAAKLAAAEKMLEIIKYLKPEGMGISENEIVKGFSVKNKKKKKKVAIMREIQNEQDKLEGYLSNKIGEIEIGSNRPPKNNQVEPKSHDRKGTTTNPKNLLLKAANLLNLKITFTDLSKSQTEFYSLLSLGVDPDQICLGKAATRDEAMEHASLNALKCLKKFDLFDYLDHSKFSEEDSAFLLALFEDDDIKFPFQEKIEKM